MKTRIISVSKSYAIRIPKTLLKKNNLSDTVEITCEGKSIVIRPVGRKAREGWEKSFMEMAKSGNEESMTTIGVGNERNA